MGKRRQRCIDRTGRFGLNWTIARVDWVDPDRARATKQDATWDVARYVMTSSRRPEIARLAACRASEEP